MSSLQDMCGRTRGDHTPDPSRASSVCKLSPSGNHFRWLHLVIELSVDECIFLKLIYFIAVLTFTSMFSRVFIEWVKNSYLILAQRSCSKITNSPRKGSPALLTHAKVKSSHRRCSVRKDAPKKLSIFTRKHLCWSFRLIKTRTQVFPCEV